MSDPIQSLHIRLLSLHMEISTKRDRRIRTQAPTRAYGMLPQGQTEATSLHLLLS